MVTTDEDTAWQRLRDAASAPYRVAGRFAWHFARGKLGRDPVFRRLLAAGWIAPRAHVVDIGCGQGLLTSLLRAVDAAAGTWPSTWSPPPIGARVTGIELMARDIDRARAALGDQPAFIRGDMCTTPLPGSDVVVILDVLHYVPHDAQDALLARIAASLATTKGRLLLRVGDVAQQRGYAVSQWVDRVVTRIRGHRVSPTFGRTVDEWHRSLRAVGFTVVAHPMSQGTPFANVLLVCELAS